MSKDDKKAAFAAFIFTLICLMPILTAIYIVVTLK